MPLTYYDIYFYFLRDAKNKKLGLKIALNFLQWCLLRSNLSPTIKYKVDPIRNQLSQTKKQKVYEFPRWSHPYYCRDFSLLLTNGFPNEWVDNSPQINNKTLTLFPRPNDYDVKCNVDGKNDIPSIHG